MLPLLAIITTLSLTGDVPVEGGDYQLVTFEVPEGVVEIEVQHSDGSDANILDWGLISPAGFRGWGGGLEEPAIVGIESSRGYLPGAIESGTWTLVIGKALISEPPATYDLQVILKDATTLTPRERAAYADTILKPEARWYQGDFHVHSSESGDAAASFAEIEALAAERGLDFVALSDHNTISQHALVAAFQESAPDVLFLRSCEVTTYGGHGGAVGISSYVDHKIGQDGRTAAQMIDEVAAQDGLFIVNHPNLDLGSACLGCAWNHADTPWQEVGGIELQTGSYDYFPVFGRSNLEMWDGLLDQGYRIAGVGGSDDHRAGQEQGATAAVIGSPTTVVFAETLSEAAIMQGVREGRVVLKLRGPDDPMIELHASAGDTKGIIGDTVVGDTIKMAASVEGGSGYKLALYENGKLVEEVVAIDSDAFEFSWTRKIPEAGARYRVHIVEGAGAVVITSHVYAEFAKAGSGGCGCSSGGQGAGAAWLALGLLAFCVGRGRARRSPPL